MNARRDPDAILAAWLDEGPNRLPEATKRAIAVTTRTTHQTRRPMRVPWRFSTMNGTSRLALAAVAVVAVALGGLYLFNRAPQGGVGGPGPSTSPSASPTPSVAPSPSAAAVPAMTQAFISPWYGYSIRYPTGWTVAPATTFFDPVEWSRGDGPSEWLDVIAPPTGGLFRLASAAIPVGADGEAWITTYYGDCAPTCQDVVIGGQPARLRDADGDEIEATLVVGQRAYVFTLFAGGGALTNGRALFDALVATVELHPEDAQAAPSPSPSSNPSPS